MAKSQLDGNKKQLKQFQTRLDKEKIGSMGGKSNNMQE